MSTLPTDFESYSKRAAGRRRYNEQRQFVALLRQRRVIGLLWEIGPGTHGYQTIIAAKLGVSRSTISRDLQRLKLRVKGGRNAEEAYLAEKRWENAIRAETKWLEELAEAKSENDDPDGSVPANVGGVRPGDQAPLQAPVDSDTPVPREVTSQTLQVPRWLRPVRTVSRSRTFPERSRSP